MWTKAYLAAALGAAIAVLGGGASAADMRGSLAAGADPMSLTGEAGEIIFSAVQAGHEIPAAAPGAPVAEAEPAPPPAPVAEESDPALRMLAHTPDEVEGYFDLYLYVSKAEAGPIAQHMLVYQRDAAGQLALIYDWPVSTGREKRERTPSGRKTYTHTPEGIFKLDSNRFHKLWKSRTWNADMPWTMFLDTIENGGMSGLAIHAAGKGKISQLGRRASGGCIRLHPDNAKFLFQMIQNNYAGLVPVFAMDGNSTNLGGVPARTADGAIMLTYGYRVVLQIEDYPGVELPALSVAATSSQVGTR
jgi:lipoprotein-anchoring transpeptidase ErfK/SrfK